MLLRIERGGEARGPRVLARAGRLGPARVPRRRRGGRARARRSRSTALQRAHRRSRSEQMRGFAARQRATLRDLRGRAAAGRRARPPPRPGRGGRRLRAGRPLPDARLLVHDGRSWRRSAGVGRVVACAPPRARRRHAPGDAARDRRRRAPTRSLCLGGVQALAAMAFGLCGVEPVDMLVGAGNAYVAEAKRQLFGRGRASTCSPGPTEILVIADETADAELVAADLLGQAEHGPTSPAVLVTTSEPLARGGAGGGRAGCSRAGRPRRSRGQAWRDHGRGARSSRDREEAVAARRRARARAPRGPGRRRGARRVRGGLRNYGSLFLGEQATVAYGDKAVGTNHVLPTGGAARYTGGLWVGKFLKTVTYQRLTARGHARGWPRPSRRSRTPRASAGHALTAELRLERARMTGAARRRRSPWSRAPAAASAARARGRSRGAGAVAGAARPLARAALERGRREPAGGRAAACDVTRRGTRVRDALRSAPTAVDVLVTLRGRQPPRAVPRGRRGRARLVAGRSTCAARSSPRRRRRARMVERGRGGAIVHVTSQMGHVGAPEPQRLLRRQARRRGHDEGHARSSWRRTGSASTRSRRRSSRRR